MKRLLVPLILAALAACRGEPVPRDYQNAPPAMTHPPQSKQEAPSEHGLDTPPQPTTGVEGRNISEPVTPPLQPTTTTMPERPPIPEATAT